MLTGKRKIFKFMQTLDQGQGGYFHKFDYGAIGIIGKDGKGLYKMLKSLELSSQRNFLYN